MTTIPVKENPRSWRYTAARYALAVLAVAVAALLRWALPTVLGEAPHLPFYMAIVTVAALGGWKPGLLATVLSMLVVDLAFTAPLWEFSPDPYEWVRQGIFVLGGAAISLLAGRLHVAKMVAEQEAAAARQAAEALRSSEERFRTLYEQGPLAIALADMDRHFIKANPVLCAMLGYTEAELVGRTFEEITHPEDRDATSIAAHQLFEGQSASYHLEKRYVRKDSCIVWCRVNACLVHDAAGKPRYAVGMIEDISRRKADEAALRSAIDAAQAATSQAEQAKAAAEAANTAKDQFLAVLSHELRNPLTPVLATAAMLQNDPRFDADTHEALDMIRRNAELESRLIDDLLDITRIARGKVELHRQPMALGTILQHAIEVCRSDLEARQLHFGVEAPPAPCLVDADATRLQQVFWNLLRNAIKFTPPGGCVGLRVRLADEGFVMAEVMDSGVGIDAEALERIFRPFEQAERGITRQFGGLGLGLAISKAMVEMHGGTISAYSAGIGMGATFSVRLPLCQHTDLAAPSPAAPPETSTPPREPRHAALRILLVEDHGDTARIMSRLLRAAGHVVANAGDVATALKLTDQQTFDLLVSDLGLPDGSGLDIMRSVRTRGLDLPGIALSGYGQELDVRRSREAGFLAHLTKPVSLPRLAEAMAQAVGHRAHRGDESKMWNPL